MLWNPLGGLSKCLLLLHLDPVLALQCHLSSLGIGHSENVVSSYSSVHTAVAWDGLSELLHLWLVVIHAEESILSLLKGLRSDLLLSLS